jgi:hypothetical protein
VDGKIVRGGDINFIVGVARAVELKLGANVGVFF